jgi:hypothetical protein
MENVEHATAAPGETRDVRYACGRPVFPMVHEIVYKKPGQKKPSSARVTSPFCALEDGHEGPCAGE